MGMERRGQLILFRRGVNQVFGRNPPSKRSRWLGEKSRMSREAPVRFCEGLGVKLPRATRPLPFLLGLSGEPCISGPDGPEPQLAGLDSGEEVRRGPQWLARESALWPSLTQTRSFGPTIANRY